MSLVVRGGFLGKQWIITRRWEFHDYGSAGSIGSALGSDGSAMGINYTATDGQAET